MIDPRREAILISNLETQVFEDKTAEIAHYDTRSSDGKVRVRFKRAPKVFLYGSERVLVLREPLCVPVDTTVAVRVNGVVWAGATEVRIFRHAYGSWERVFYRKGNGEDHRSFAAESVQIVGNLTQEPKAAGVLGYWCEIVSCLPQDDPLQYPYQGLHFVDPESALGAYLMGAPITTRELKTPPIFPFQSNLSQRAAVENALTNSISVIEGPPGTGKTETILNLIANIVATGAGTVGVVSLSNPAVDNVSKKLCTADFEYFVAELGNKEKREGFFGRQQGRNRKVDELVRNAPDEADPERLAEVDGELRQLQKRQRERSELRVEIDEYALEQRHFELYVQRHEVPELNDLPLLRRSSERILDYLIESQFEHDADMQPGLFRRIRRYFKYGSLRDLDADDTGAVLRLQRVYYEKRIEELKKRLDRVENELQKKKFDQLTEEHRDLSLRTLRSALHARYSSSRRQEHEPSSYRSGANFGKFIREYPVVLSTCHSLRSSIAEGYLFDYLIIDESSQVDLLTAALAMSCCRNLVVVGDLKQLPQITNDVAGDLASPQAAYDYTQHNILSSLMHLYGDRLPSTLLREHYRCDPAIIGFCNKMFYEGELLPYTNSGQEQPMIVVRTVEGNHMRQHRAGGRSNQREVDVVVNEVLPEHCHGVAPGEIGITTPYRRQVGKVTDALTGHLAYPDGIKTNTVHKFQGGEKEVVVLTTVLDDSWRGRTGLSFVDDPQLINVAVSRAVKKFILVTNNKMMPASRYIRDLIGYIGYRTPGDAGANVFDSEIVSMFDLLYREYSDRLKPFAARLKDETKYASENIIWTLLREILEEDEYKHLTVSEQVLVQNLIVDLSGLTPRQESYVRHRASVDFVVYNRVTNRPVQVFEVDGFAFHENNPAQLERDAIKDEIFRTRGLPLLRLRTTESSEEQRIREALNKADAIRSE